MKENCKFIEYNDDFACDCRLRKRHSSGLKILYSITVEYFHREDVTLAKKWVMTYGNFSEAFSRYNCEISGIPPCGFALGKLSLVHTVFKDSEILLQEPLMCYFGKGNNEF